MPTGGEGLKLRVRRMEKERDTLREGMGHRPVHTYNFCAWLMRLYSTLICGGRQEGDAGTVGNRPAHPCPILSCSGLGPQQRHVSPRISAASFSPSDQTSQTPAGGSSLTVPGLCPWWADGLSGGVPGHTLGSEGLRNHPKPHSAPLSLVLLVPFY